MTTAGWNCQFQFAFSLCVFCKWGRTSSVSPPGTKGCYSEHFWRRTIDLIKFSTTVLFEALCTSSIFHLSCLWNNIFGRRFWSKVHARFPLSQCFLYSCSWRLLHPYLNSLVRIICSVEQIVLQDWLYCNTIKLSASKYFCFVFRNE